MNWRIVVPSSNTPLLHASHEVGAFNVLWQHNLKEVPVGIFKVSQG
jgi:hypothetical protein